MIKSFEILFLYPTCEDKTLLKHVEISLSLIHCLINFDHHVRVFRIAHVGENNIEREEEKKQNINSMMTCTELISLLVRYSLYDDHRQR